MKTITKLAAVVLLTLTFTSCHAVRGVGRDIQFIGNKIEQKASRISPY